MIVHFATSTKNINNRIETLRLLISAIKESGHTVDRDWLEQALNTDGGDMDLWKRTSAEVLSSLKGSDAVIIEASIDSFSMGFQAALALQMKKPLLILRKTVDGKGDYFDRDGALKVVEQTVLAGEPRGLKTVEVYESPQEAALAIRDFLARNDIPNSDLRFNLFLDRESYQYLDRVARESGRTKAKIIRDILHEKNREE